MKSRGYATVCLYRIYQSTLLIPTVASINPNHLSEPDFYQRLTAIVRPTSHDGSGLVFRVEWAAAPSILCNNLTSITLDKGEVCSVLEETHTHTHHMSHAEFEVEL